MATSADEAIVERLLAGEWKFAMRLLDLPEQDVLKEWQGHRRSTSPNRWLDTYSRNPTLWRQALDKTLAEVAPELRFEIAQRLFAADTGSD